MDRERTVSKKIITKTERKIDEKKNEYYLKQKRITDY